MVGLSREMTVQPQWHGGLSSAHGGWRPAPRLGRGAPASGADCTVHAPCTPGGGCRCLPDDLTDPLADAAAVIIDYSQGGVYPAPAYQDQTRRARRARPARSGSPTRS